MSKKTSPGRAPRPLPDSKPASQAFMRGREFSSKFCLEFSHDELAEAIEGLREGILSHIRERRKAGIGKCQPQPRSQRHRTVTPPKKP